MTEQLTLYFHIHICTDWKLFCRVGERPKRSALTSFQIRTNLSLPLPVSHCVTVFKEFVLNQQNGDFPGGPVVKTLPSNAWGAGSIPGQGAMIPHAS